MSIDPAITAAYDRLRDRVGVSNVVFHTSFHRSSTSSRDGAPYPDLILLWRFVPAFGTWVLEDSEPVTRV